VTTESPPPAKLEKPPPLSLPGSLWWQAGFRTRSFRFHRANWKKIAATLHPHIPNRRQRQDLEFYAGRLIGWRRHGARETFQQKIIVWKAYKEIADAYDPLVKELGLQPDRKMRDLARSIAQNRPKRVAANVDIDRNRAWIGFIDLYEEITGKRATSAVDWETNKAYGPFISFMQAVMASIPGEQPDTGGDQVREFLRKFERERAKFERERVIERLLGESFPLYGEQKAKT